MNLSKTLLETNPELSYLEMCSRAAIVFLLAYILIRISGRRSFVLRSPLDSIIVILLGAILSRAVVGASPFLPVIAASTLIVVLHRIIAWLTSAKPGMGGWIAGRKITLYKKGRFYDENLKKGLIGRSEIMQQVREVMHKDNLDNIDIIYMERDGRISIIISQN